MDVDLARYDDVVHAIYDSALNPSSWQETIAAIADLCGASSALLFTCACTRQRRLRLPAQHLASGARTVGGEEHA